MSPYHRAAGPPPPAKGGSGLRVHSTAFHAQARACVFLQSELRLSPLLHAHPSTPRSYPPGTSPPSVTDGVAGLLPSRRLPPICLTLQAPPFLQPQASSSGWHLISPLQRPQGRNPGGRGRGRCGRARARARARVSLGACMRAPRRSGARARTRYPRARVPRTNTPVCLGGGGICSPGFALMRAAPARR